MLTRLLTAFAMVALAIGAFSAYSDGRFGMMALLGLAAIAAAIPVFMDPGK
ncbi:MAG: hypothetical protein KJ054_11795 [Gammaproteobacteria bacterium]|nr:hypothetical protein [Gammaproteobacteria bacterium]